jgi:DNA-binding CsgD family transcriptional regulator
VADASSTEYESIVGGLYDAALDPPRWDAALAAFFRFAHAQGEDREARMALVMPHMFRAVRLFQKRQRLLEASCFRAGALDCIATPVMVIASGAKVLFANAAGHELLHNEAASCALHEAWGIAAAEGAWVRVPPVPGGEAMLLVIAPSSCVHAHANGPVSMVLASRLRQGAVSTGAVLRQMFALTPAEARVAVAVADGLSLADVAERHAIKEETVRGQLKDVFAKLGVRRQSELARFVGGMGLIVPHDEPVRA